MPSKPAKPTKTGRISNEDKTFILKQMGHMPAAEIAKALGRRVESVEKVLREAAKLQRTRETTAQPTKTAAPTPAAAASDLRAMKADLKESAAWVNIQREFTPHELLFFEEQYLKLMSQFKGDLWPSEELQVFDLVRIEVLKSRNLQAQKISLDRINQVEAEKDILLGGRRPSELDEDESKRLTALSKSLGSLREGRKEFTAEYTALTQRSEALMKSLKSTRDQRVREIESGKETIMGLIKSLQNAEKQEQEMRMAQLMRLAAEKELDRLATPHRYEDGEYDRPILSADTVDFEPAGSPEDDEADDDDTEPAKIKTTDQEQDTQ